MTLSPIIVAICVNAGPVYNDACKAALEKGASQSGVSTKFENVTQRAEQRVIKAIDPSKEVEVVAAATGYIVQLATRRQATFATNPGLKDSSLSFSVGSEGASLNFRISF